MPALRIGRRREHRLTAEGSDRAVAYLLTRLTIGVSLFGHGLVRLPKLDAFHAQLTGEFKASILPHALVSACTYALPFFELVAGALLLVGALTRVAAVTAALVMIVLVFGSTTIEHFNVIGDQLVHAAFLAAVVAFRKYNEYSVDTLLRHNRASGG